MIISRKVSQKCRRYQMDPVKKSGGLWRSISTPRDVQVQSGEWGRLNMLWSHFGLLSFEGQESTWEHSAWICKFLYSKNISVLCQWFLLFLSERLLPGWRCTEYRVVSCHVRSRLGGNTKTSHFKEMIQKLIVIILKDFLSRLASVTTDCPLMQSLTGDSVQTVSSPSHPDHTSQRFYCL